MSFNLYIRYFTLVVITDMVFSQNDLPKSARYQGVDKIWRDDISFDPQYIVQADVDFESNVMDVHAFSISTKLAVSTKGVKFTADHSHPEPYVPLRVALDDATALIGNMKKVGIELFIDHNRGSVTPFNYRTTFDDMTLNSATVVFVIPRVRG